jgi:arginyl-tRNA synthetase
MDTLSVTNLGVLLEGLGLNAIPHFTAADIQNNPLDIARCYLADIISGLVSCNRDVAFDSIQSTNGITDGDLAIKLPKLSHTANYDDFADDLKKKVRQIL